MVESSQKEMKDANAPMRSNFPENPYMLTERLVQGNPERKNESGQLSEHDKCR